METIHRHSRPLTSSFIIQTGGGGALLCGPTSCQRKSGSVMIGDTHSEQAEDKVVSQRSFTLTCCVPAVCSHHVTQSCSVRGLVAFCRWRLCEVIEAELHVSSVTTQTGFTDVWSLYSKTAKRSSPVVESTVTRYTYLDTALKFNSLRYLGISILCCSIFW